MSIGGVLASKKVVVPNAVGVDIGCGMCAVKINFMADDISKELMRKQIMPSGIRKRIPLGMDHTSFHIRSCLNFMIIKCIT